MRKADEIINDLLKEAVHYDYTSLDKKKVIRTELSHDLFREAVALMTNQQRKIEELEERVAIQYPDVVKCKECRFAKICEIPNIGKYAECKCHEEIGYDPEPCHPLDWFCADGELKEEGEEIGKSAETVEGTAVSGMREDIHHSR